MLHGFNRDQPFFRELLSRRREIIPIFRAPPAEPEARDRRPEVRRIEDPKPCWPSSPNGANGMSDPSTQRYAVASIDGSELSTASLRTGLALVTRAGASERGQRTSFGRLRLGTSLEEPPQAR